MKNVNELVGKNIKTLRIKFDYSQRKLAQKMGKNQSTIANWELGKMSVRTDDLIKLCEIFEVELDLLVKKELILCISEVIGEGKDKKN